MTNNKTFAYAGAALVLVGLFMPIMTLPIVGSINLFANGGNPVAIILVVLAAAGALLAANGRLKDVIYAGAAAAGLLLYSFARAELAITQMRSGLTEAIKDNPFAGLAQATMASVQLQWGWLILLAGAGLMIYAAVKERRAEGAPRLLPDDANARIVAGLSLVLLAILPVFDLAGMLSPKPGAAGALAAATGPLAQAAPEKPKGPGKEEAAYIASNMQLTDLTARYHEGFGGDRSGGVDFRLKNTGSRTVSEVTVKVIFYDAAGKAIHEETYSPLDSDKPLRPNYIWQQSGTYFSAEVPSEWEAGKATASIIDLKFAPNE